MRDPLSAYQPYRPRLGTVVFDRTTTIHKIYFLRKKNHTKIHTGCLTNATALLSKGQGSATEVTAFGRSSRWPVAVRYERNGIPCNQSRHSGKRALSTLGKRPVVSSRDY